MALNLRQLVPVVKVVRSGLLLLLSTLVAPPGLGPWKLPHSAFPPPTSGPEVREALPQPALGSEARQGLPPPNLGPAAPPAHPQAARQSLCPRVDLPRQFNCELTSCDTSDVHCPIASNERICAPIQNGKA